MEPADYQAAGVPSALNPPKPRGLSGDESVAVVIPCLNEAATIQKVVGDFKRMLPFARIVVIDNRSTDDTADLAREAGARVLRESRKGKGYALIQGFRDTMDADMVVMVDGDDTYPADAVLELLGAVRDGADMAVGTRLRQPEKGAFSTSHSIGNRLFVAAVRLLFGVRTQDLLSGYRVLSRRFLDLSALVAQGFEVESELSVQAVVHGFQVTEVPIRYRARPNSKGSKLSTVRDGYRILIALISYFRDYRPLAFFGALGTILISLSLLAGVPVVLEYLSTGLVQRLPLAVLAVGLWLLGAMALIAGLVLSSVNHRAAELAALIVRR